MSFAPCGLEKCDYHPEITAKEGWQHSLRHHAKKKKVIKERKL
jgi:hypothetical protein